MRFSLDTLTSFTLAVLEKCGYTGPDAELFADSLIGANASGVDSHGITRLRTYAMRLKCGGTKRDAEPVIVKESPSMLLIDTRDGMGVPACRWALDRCIERAKQTGVCFAALNHGNHFGMAGFHTAYGAERGMITIAMSNTAPIVAPTGGKQPVLGTNPLSIAIPSKKYGSFLLDMATCTVAQGKVILAGKEGKKIPLNWAIDQDGHPTDEPAEAIKGAMLPFGDYKGYGISLMIEILCCALTGAFMSSETISFWHDMYNSQGLGFVLGVFDVSKIVDPDVFDARVEKVIDAIKGSELAEGSEGILIAGEKEQQKRAYAAEHGVEIGMGVYNDLVSLADELGVPRDMLCELK